MVRRFNRGWSLATGTVAPRLVCALVLALPTTGVRADEAAPEARTAEGSILVERRNEPLADDAASTESGDALAPISQISEHAPRPADPEPIAPSAAEESGEPMVEADNTTAAEEAVAETDALASDKEDIAAAYQQKPYSGPASFREALPGETTLDELTAAWGEPSGSTATAGGEVLLYEMDSFARVDVLVEDEVVEIVRVELSRKEAPAKLERRLAVSEIESVAVTDPETGDTLAVAYPEKGLMLLLESGDAPTTPDDQPVVTHIVLTRLDAEAFALRAERRPAAEMQKRLADLDRAIAIEPAYGHAHYLAAGVRLATGQVDLGVESAEAAVDSDPDNAAYRLRLAKAWVEQGEYDKAVIETRAVLDAEKQDSLVKAEALHAMGRLASFGDAAISDKAIGFHTMAIAIADKLATTADNKDRRAAKRLLVDAHLAIAGEVSRRDYDRKTEVVAQWIGRASALAEEMIKNDEGGLELRLVVARDALKALANLKPTKDPQPWIDEANEAANALRESTTDPLMTARVEWMLGEAHFHAVRIEHTRGRAEEALGYGESAIEHLMAGAASGDIRPAAERLVGRLYFHLGAVHAVHRRDHEKALSWYERARPLLEGDAPESRLHVPRRRGEALVSMAVSFWNQEQKDLALELTASGAELMERAVKAGVLEEKALGVPYGNLATMHSRLGDEQKSSEFAKLARNVRGVATASRQAEAGRATSSRKSR